ncbi:MAG: 2-phospho-L-lactate transferase [Promethearchaeota archaeon]
MIVALAGGIGAAKLLEGICAEIPPEDLFVVVNTGDDRTFFGLHVSPDLDIVTYTLAGVVDPVKRWGWKEDTFVTLESLRRYYGSQDTWFGLGDKDLATHLFRTDLLRQGKRLSDAADAIRVRLGVKSQVVPMSDDPQETHVVTPAGAMHFEEYLVRHQTEVEVTGVEFKTRGPVKPAPGVIEAIRESERVVICPSNPVVSIGPILAVPGVRDVLKTYKFKVVAVSPIVEGKPVKGPADKLMKALGHEVSCVGVARLYQDVASTFVIDERDRELAPAVEKLGYEVVVTNTMMTDLNSKSALARACLGVGTR